MKTTVLCHCPRCVICRGKAFNLVICKLLLSINLKCNFATWIQVFASEATAVTTEGGLSCFLTLLLDKICFFESQFVGFIWACALPLVSGLALHHCSESLCPLDLVYHFQGVISKSNNSPSNAWIPVFSKACSNILLFTGKDGWTAAVQRRHCPAQRKEEERSSLHCSVRWYLLRWEDSHE